MIPVSELTDFDYEILEKALEGTIQKQELIASFPNQSVAKLRVETLSRQDYRKVPASFPPPIPNTSYLRKITMSEIGERPIYTGEIEITELGKKALEEWRLQKKENRRKLLEDRISKFAPIVISIIALIVAITSLLQSLHWIDLEKSAILSALQSQEDSPNNSDDRFDAQPPQSP